MSGCSILLEDGSFLLQEDGTSHLLLENCVPDAGGVVDAGHGASWPSVWYYRKLAERKRRLRDEDRKRRVTLKYVERLVDAFVEADAEDAARLAESARRLDALIDRTNTQFAYLAEVVAQFVAAAEAAARAETQRQIEARLIEAAELAQRIEAELIDEEEAILLLMGS